MLQTFRSITVKPERLTQVASISLIGLMAQAYPRPFGPLNDLFVKGKDPGLSRRKPGFGHSGAYLPYCLLISAGLITGNCTREVQ